MGNRLSSQLGKLRERSGTPSQFPIRYELLLLSQPLATDTVRGQPLFSHIRWEPNRILTTLSLSHDNRYDRPIQCTYFTLLGTYKSMAWFHIMTPRSIYGRTWEGLTWTWYQKQRVVPNVLHIGGNNGITAGIKTIRLFVVEHRPSFFMPIGYEGRLSHFPARWLRTGLAECDQPGKNSWKQFTTAKN